MLDEPRSYLFACCCGCVAEADGCGEETTPIDDGGRFSAMLEFMSDVMSEVMFVTSIGVEIDILWRNQRKVC